MNTTGIVRRMDDLGRIVIPKEIRQRCGIKEGDPFEIGTEGTTLILKKYKSNMNYHECFQEMISNMKDDDVPFEKILHITRMFEAIEYMIKDKKEDSEETT